MTSDVAVTGYGFWTHALRPWGQMPLKLNVHVLQLDQGLQGCPLQAAHTGARVRGRGVGQGRREDSGERIELPPRPQPPSLSLVVPGPLLSLSTFLNYPEAKEIRSDDNYIKGECWEILIQLCFPGRFRCLIKLPQFLQLEYEAYRTSREGC